ncbi:hypothetical protein V5799_007277 [Amblyomma americanum]|uniref:Reverse transcriptase domain-containing protein n=1 Tax=Amblyomma americanum TaxID=6943 RepID=A0AAQ4DU02_AMBAM
MKGEVKAVFQDRRVRLAREARVEIRVVSDAIIVLSSPLSQKPSIAPTLVALWKKLHQLLNRWWDRLRATARAERWECETWYPRHLLRRRLNTKSDTLTVVQDPTSGAITSAPEEVLEKARQFYSELHAAEPCDAGEFALNSPQAAPTVDDTYQTGKELLAALNEMKPNISPGTDGLTPAFYKKFWPIIKKPLADLTNVLLDEGKLIPTMNEGMIILLCKDPNRETDLSA